MPQPRWWSWAAWTCLVLACLSSAVLLAVAMRPASVPAAEPAPVTVDYPGDPAPDPAPRQQGQTQKKKPKKQTKQPPLLVPSTPWAPWVPWFAVAPPPPPPMPVHVELTPFGYRVPRALDPYYLYAPGTYASARTVSSSRSRSSTSVTVK